MLQLEKQRTLADSVNDLKLQLKYSLDENNRLKLQNRSLTQVNQKLSEQMESMNRRGSLLEQKLQVQSYEQRDLRSRAEASSGQVWDMKRHLRQAQSFNESIIQQSELQNIMSKEIIQSLGDQLKQFQQFVDATQGLDTSQSLKKVTCLSPHLKLAYKLIEGGQQQSMDRLFSTLHMCINVTLEEFTRILKQNQQLRQDNRIANQRSVCQDLEKANERTNYLNQWSSVDSKQQSNDSPWKKFHDELKLLIVRICDSIPSEESREVLYRIIGRMNDSDFNKSNYLTDRDIERYLQELKSLGQHRTTTNFLSAYSTPSGVNSQKISFQASMDKHATQEQSERFSKKYGSMG